MATLKVIHTASGEVVRSITVSGSERQIDKTEMGLLRNMNRDEYHVARDSDEAAALARKEGE